MPYDYGQYFGEITLTHDLTTLPGERTWRLAPPGRDVAAHEIVLYLGCNVLRTSNMTRPSPPSSTSPGPTTWPAGDPPTSSATANPNPATEPARNAMTTATAEPSN